MRLSNQDEEQQWQEFKNHIDWPERFSLIIFFVDDNFLVQLFRERLYHQLKGQVSALKILQPDNPATLTLDFFAALESEIIPDTKVPLWLEIYQRSQPWDIARNTLFARLNEYRDQFRRQSPYPVIILVPLSYKRHLREIAPDLWSVRSYTDEFLSSSSLHAALSSAPQAQMIPEQSYDFQKNTIDITEWQRIQQREASVYEQLQIGWRAFDAAFNQGNRPLAEEIIDHNLSLVQKQLKQSPASPHFLRYLTVFLNKKGALKNVQGRREAAYDLYQESLKIRRRLLETLGETPETLHDLAVALYQFGHFEKTQEQHQQANHYFHECLKIVQRLSLALPDNPDYIALIKELEKII